MPRTLPAKASFSRSRPRSVQALALCRLRLSDEAVPWQFVPNAVVVRHEDGGAVTGAAVYQQGCAMSGNVGTYGVPTVQRTNMTGYGSYVGLNHPERDFHDGISLCAL